MHLKPVSLAPLSFPSLTPCLWWEMVGCDASKNMPKKVRYTFREDNPPSSKSYSPAKMKTSEDSTVRTALYPWIPKLDLASSLKPERRGDYFCQLINGNNMALMPRNCDIAWPHRTFVRQIALWLWCWYTSQLQKQTTCAKAWTQSPFSISPDQSPVETGLQSSCYGSIYGAI